jgi:hypothetical protein
MVNNYLNPIRIMKAIKNYIWMAAATMMVATFGACSNEDLAVEEAPVQKSKIVTLTATLGPKDGPTTRALTDNGTSIGSTWAENEKVLVKYLSGAYSSPAEAEGTVTSVDGNGKATITVALDDPTEGDTPISFYYPYVSYTGEKLIGMEQTGTLADISANYDRVSGSGTLNVTSGTPTLPDDVGMTREVCIWKLAFTDGVNDITADITNLTISDGNGNDYIVSPPAGAKSTIWVAMAGITSKTVTITATTGSGLYTIEKVISLANGKFYHSTVPLTATTTANKYVVYTSGVDHYDAVIPSVATAVTSSATDVTWNAGTYLVSADATIDGNVSLAGNVNLILCDDATLTINGKFVNPQDASYNYTYSMNIYGQSAGTGGLTLAHSDINGMAHHLNIHGGVFTSNAPSVAQAIETSGRFNVYHGTINVFGQYGGIVSLGNMFVYGGSITANATSSAGIMANNDLTISSGTIFAQSTDQMEGIAVYGNGVISGGNITAQGGAGSGIGFEGTLTMSGGTLTATGGDGSEAEYKFEDGAAGYDGELTMTGGTLIATGGAGVGIGSNALGISNSTSITLSGVTMYEDDNPNPSTPAADQDACTKQYVIIQ